MVLLSLGGWLTAGAPVAVPTLLVVCILILDEECIGLVRADRRAAFSRSTASSLLMMACNVICSGLPATFGAADGGAAVPWRSGAVMYSRCRMLASCMRGTSGSLCDRVAEDVGQEGACAGLITSSGGAAPPGMEVPIIRFSAELAEPKESDTVAARAAWRPGSSWW